MNTLILELSFFNLLSQIPQLSMLIFFIVINIELGTYTVGVYEYYQYMKQNLSHEQGGPIFDTLLIQDVFFANSETCQSQLVLTEPP